MSYLDAHMAHRIATGLKIFAADITGLALFAECLDGSIPTADIGSVYSLLFPDPPEGVAVKIPKVSVRTSYKGLMDARIGGAPGGDEGGGTAHFPAIVIDLVNEQVTGSMGGRGRRHTYEQTVEVMIIAQTKVEVRALHVLVQELVLDSTEFFTALGYLGSGPDLTQGGDIRPVDAAMAGLMPNLLGMMQRYQRWTAKIVRKTPYIYSTAPEVMGTISLHHVDSTGIDGVPGKANPLPVE